MSSPSLPGAGGGHTGWVCDKCGQALTGALDECNSGIHVGPDGKNKGRAVRPGGGHTADGERIRGSLAHDNDCDVVRSRRPAVCGCTLRDDLAALARLEAAANRSAEAEARVRLYVSEVEIVVARAEAAEAERDAALAALQPFAIEPTEPQRARGYISVRVLVEWLDVARAVLGGPQQNDQQHA